MAVQRSEMFLRFMFPVFFMLIISQTQVWGTHQEHDNGNYHFEYGVHDPHTGDIKTHSETRHGKYVYGEYSLVEPDGTKRIVKYRVGPHTGFEAIVERVGHAHHPGHHGHDGSSYVETTFWGNQGHNQHNDK